MNDRFVQELDIEAFEGALTNATQIGDALAELDLPKTQKGESVLAKAHRLKAAGYDGPIAHLLQEEWELFAGDRVGIAPKFWKQIELDMQLINRDDVIKSYLSGGFAEVSVLWTDERTKTKMKARLDYLKRDQFTDFKTFDNSMRKHIDQCIHNAFQYNRYYIQAYLYWQVVEMIRDGDAGSIQGDYTDAQEQFINDIMGRKDPMKIWYVFQEKNGVPNLLAREIKFMTEVHPSHEHNASGVSRETSNDAGQKTRRKNALGRKASVEIDHAINLFNYYTEAFDETQRWSSLKPIGVIDDDCFSPYWLEEDE